MAARIAATELTDARIEELYGSLMRQASEAFRSDPSYLVDMAEHASLINYKRALWTARSEVAKSEKRARELCEQRRPANFTCGNTAACGFGTCLFATEEDREIPVEPLVAPSGKLSERPAPATVPSYSIDDTIQAALAHKGIRPPAKLSGGPRRKSR